jgi:hypothetical protein
MVREQLETDSADERRRQVVAKTRKLIEATRDEISNLCDDIAATRIAIARSQTLLSHAGRSPSQARSR